jgi:threonine aldolase
MKDRLSICQERANELSKVWTNLGGGLDHPTETNMIWQDLQTAGIDKEHFVDFVEKRGWKIMRGRLQGRLVIHYQICNESLVRMKAFSTMC